MGKKWGNKWGIPHKKWGNKVGKSAPEKVGKNKWYDKRANTRLCCRNKKYIELRETIRKHTKHTKSQHIVYNCELSKIDRIHESSESSNTTLHLIKSV